MRPEISPYRSHLIEYDSMRRRLWILGQRCHHGATGSLLAALACAGIVTGAPVRPRPLVAAAAAGGALMAHDWKDRTMWFERGHGTQP